MTAIIVVIAWLVTDRLIVSLGLHRAGCLDAYTQPCSENESIDAKCSIASRAPILGWHRVQNLVLLRCLPDAKVVASPNKG